MVYGVCRLSPTEYRQLCMPAMRQRATLVDRLILDVTQVVHQRLCAGPDRFGKYTNELEASFPGRGGHRPPIKKNWSENILPPVKRRQEAPKRIHMHVKF